MKKIYLILIALLVSTSNTSEIRAGWEGASTQICEVTLTSGTKDKVGSFRRAIENGYNLQSSSWCREKIILKSDVYLNGTITIGNSLDSDGVIIESDPKANKKFTINLDQVPGSCAITVNSNRIKFNNVTIRGAQNTAVCLKSNLTRVENSVIIDNQTGISVEGTGSVIKNNVIQNNEAYGVMLQNKQNEVTQNDFLNNAVDLVSPYTDIQPTILEVAKEEDGDFVVHLEFPTSPALVELYRTQAKAGTSTDTYIGSFSSEIIGTQANIVLSDDELKEKEIIYAISFLNKATSAQSNKFKVVTTEETGSGSGSTNKCTKPATNNATLNRACQKGYGSASNLQDTDCDGDTDNKEDFNKNCLWDPGIGETNAVDSDSDDDGLHDGLEDKDKDGKYDEATETNPLSDDTDGDFISDYDEDANHDGLKNTKECNPLKADTDGDKIPDNKEDTDLDGKYDAATETSCYLTDSDFDTLPDGKEDGNYNGLIEEDLKETDPKKADSDGDGKNDLTDVCPMDNNLACKKPCYVSEIPADGLDSDYDGLDDKDEDYNHDCQSTGNETDFRKSDTDGDGKIDRFDPCPLDSSPECVFVCNPSSVIPDAYDSDRDGLGNKIEDADGDCFVDSSESDPNNADTDGDGIPDGIEVNMGSSPFLVDSDSDGLDDDEEDLNKDGKLQSGETSPTKADTDGDGVSDRVDPCPNSADAACNKECKVGQIPPADKDSDNDSLSDGEEDPDHDCFRDPGETDPYNSDTDGDGIPDGLETSGGSGSLNSDADKDQLPDGIEDANKNGIKDTTECDPNMKDTDGDGVSDNFEDKNNNGLRDSGETACYLADSDNDGVTDGNEDKNKNGIVDAGETSPILPDSDGDKVLDGVDPNPIKSSGQDFEDATGINQGCSLNKNSRQSASLLIVLAMYGLLMGGVTLKRRLK